MSRHFQSVIDDTPALLLRDSLLRAAEDPKFPGFAAPVYVPLPDHERALKILSDPARVRPFDPARDAAGFHGAAQHGLLYLPFPYLVPGGRFNEMYGWDTAFAVFAWADTHPRLMREQVDNQLYQIRMYGKVLNANRTYYLSRSQPPLIAAMALRVWRAARDRPWADFDPDGLYGGAGDWLERALPDLENHHTYWTSGERLAGETGLSRYWDDAEEPPPEVPASEDHDHFALARAHFSRQDLTPEEQEDKALFYDDATGALTGSYYRADRALRASGFDLTAHWGYGGLRCMFHAPVCLNALLYGMEGDLAEIAAALRRPEDEAAWKNRRARRKALMMALMVDPETGLYQDHDFMRKRRNPKPYASIFHALWVGLYDDNPATARRAAETALKSLETPFGIAMSDEASGCQWDWPYGWPPAQYFAFTGLARCGLTEEARRVAEKYVSLAARIFEANGAIYEKYNMAEGSAEIRVTDGYSENVSEHGTFLWTAATLKSAQDFLKS